jgi:two-component system, OmpR family, manganese sensing sensor histidine kinase
MFQTTRKRLALWYTAVTAVVLLLFATGIYLYVRSTLIERVDDTLNHVVEVVSRSLAIEPLDPTNKTKFRVNLEASFRDNANSVEDDRIDLEWFSPTGELLWSTFSFPLNIPIHVNRTGETVRVVIPNPLQLPSLFFKGVGEGGNGRVGELFEPKLNTQNSELRTQNSELKTQNSKLSPPSYLILRQLTERVEIGRQVVGYLRVSHPWFEVTKPSRQLILDLTLGISLMIISVGAIGWFLSGLAIEPVRESYQRLKQFTADASHELRSPIAMIQTNVQVALADPDPQPQLHRQQLQVVERLTQRLGGLVDDLLFLARQDSNIVQLSFEPVHLDALLMEVIEEQRLSAIAKKINLSLEIAPPPSDFSVRVGEWGRVGGEASQNQLDSEAIYTLEADWDQLARLFTNLVGNALQYTPNNGAVELELQQIRRYNQTQLQVKVKDTGVGIPESALPHIFDRFYRVDPSRSRGKIAGSGLGLAIAFAIVQNHKGHIRVDSIVDRGTTFTVTFPQTSDER